MDTDPKVQRQFLEKALMGNQHAISFCETVFDISQIWDDIIDCDNDFTDEDVNRMMWQALVVLPNNPFYQQFFETLNPILQVFMVDWMDSNKLVKGNEDFKAAAYVLRDSVSSLVTHCARIVGGYNWMLEISMELRELLYNEPLKDYIKEHNQ